MAAMTKHVLCGILLFVFFATYLPVVLAVPVPATGLTAMSSSRRNLSTADVNSTDAMAGNVTRLDINALSITTSWQGFYGNISGNIILADAQNNSLYEWGNGTGFDGEVFAARNNSIDWNTINCSNATHVSQEESHLGQSSSDTDSVTNTYNETDHPDFLVGTRNMTSCPSTNAWTNGARNANNWHQILLADAGNKTVYTTIIDIGTTGYDGSTWDFQLLVGENGKTGNEATTTYYFYTELS